MDKILYFIFGLAALLIAVSIIRKKHDFLAPISKVWNQSKRKYPLLSHVTTDVKYMIRHPIDCLYDIKYGKRGSVAGAVVMYISALFIRMLSSTFTAFTFNSFEIASWMNPYVLMLTICIPVALFVVGNYLIGSINDGEGTFKNVFVAMGYAFSAYIVFTPFVTLLTHVLTQSEVFLVRFPTFLILAYTLVLVFLSAKETHGYSPKETVKNLLLTLVFIILAILAMFILYALWNELITFVGELFEEVKYRVFT